VRAIRLYTHQNLAPDIELELEDDIRHYAFNVLRLNKHSSLRLFNGDGYDYGCEIITCSKSSLHVQLTEQIERHSESSLTTHLYLGVSKSSHMDYAIQKTVEAGVSAIHPILTERTVSKVTGKSSQNKHQHWQRIIQSACEQCGRAVLPKLLPISQFHEIEELSAGEYGLMFDATANETMSSLTINIPSAIKLLIGAEGGFAEHEINLALGRGFQAVRCGPRILRTETAALAAVLMAQSLYGDLNS